MTLKTLKILKILKILKYKQDVFVHPATKESRFTLINDLEQAGYRCLHDKESMIDSIFPLIVSFKNKTVSPMNSITCAACAASSGAIMNENEFYELLSDDEEKR